MHFQEDDLSEYNFLFLNPEEEDTLIAFMAVNKPFSVTFDDPETTEVLVCLMGEFYPNSTGEHWRQVWNRMSQDVMAVVMRDGGETTNLTERQHKIYEIICLAGGFGAVCDKQNQQEQAGSSRGRPDCGQRENPQNRLPAVFEDPIQDFKEKVLKRLGDQEQQIKTLQENVRQLEHISTNVASKAASMAVKKFMQEGERRLQISPDARKEQQNTVPGGIDAELNGSDVDDDINIVIQELLMDQIQRENQEDHQ